MKTIKILGTGCPKCKQTESVINEALALSGQQAEVIKVEDIQKIMEYNVMSTPAIVVDEVLKMKGKVPTVSEVLALLA
ncbi:MAG: thioredoxin family protein [Algoriphagus sp.]|uniref:thioredoxin family protein n=1 Tax=Algoriphagus sp. TaxID=1872435 RepID=UPI002717969A|nr:thioredoxin family protein [Algoriphagus sp.]MDO8968022.1 thioredoxin family protein [Algoriphagus sp.]MDP2040037.1 thioredoxin family protein [Algoriphagus sp.]MDP3199094.1 thioredoxin family protein [Algoriphagus sp.]MDP3472587.1 thioredoxin family protein [Algoriphagus sp.]